MIEHKIQSNSGLQLNLKQVPKMLKTIVNTWCKDCFIISFKLEWLLIYEISDFAPHG